MSSKFGGSAVIEGSLTAAIDDDSSDDERDDEPPQDSHFDAKVAAHVTVDDDDEELEVFSKGVVHVSTSSSAPQPAPTAGNSLIDAMMASVSEVEMSGTEVLSRVPKAVNGPKGTDPFPVKTAATAVGDGDKPEAVDMFGIAYKPFMKKGDGYSLPKGAAFEDEAEFEKEMYPSKAAKSEEEDDEFDIDVAEDTANNGNSGNNGGFNGNNNGNIGDSSENNMAAAEKRAAERAARAAREAEEEALFMAAVKDETRAQIEKQRESAADVNINEESSVAKPSILVAAKQALDEIVGIYSSGLGDQEVLMLGVDNEQGHTPSGGGGGTQKGVSTIDEGDEEEAEREEQEEETALAENVLQTMKLEAEWANLAEEGEAGGEGRGAKSLLPSSEALEGGDDCFTAVTYAEALECLRGEDFSAYERMITVRDEERASWSLNRPVALKFNGCEDQLRFPFLLAQHNYEASSLPLRDILRTIFKTLTALDELPSSISSASSSSSPKDRSLSVSCPAVGPHWERIGFQGLDPRTDVNRSMKMLAILQALNMVEAAPSLVRKLFLMANLPPSVTGGLDLTWPFMCVSIMFTKEAVQALRSGELNKECNRREDILSVMHHFHQACFFDFAKRVIADPVLHHAVHLSKVRDACKKSPMGMVKAYAAESVSEHSSLSIEALLARLPRGNGAGAGVKNQGTGSSDTQPKKSEGKYRLFGGKIPAGSAITAPKVEEVDPEIETEEGDMCFDDLDRIEDEKEAHGERSITKSIWSSLTGGGKASKFKA